jgi:hypothetical protein
MALLRLSYVLAMCCGGKRYSCQDCGVSRVLLPPCLCKAEAARAGFSKPRQLHLRFAAYFIRRALCSDEGYEIMTALHTSDILMSL